MQRRLLRPGCLGLSGWTPGPTRANEASRVTVRVSGARHPCFRRVSVVRSLKLTWRGEYDRWIVKHVGCQFCVRSSTKLTTSLIREFFFNIIFLIRIRKILRGTKKFHKYSTVGSRPAETLLSARWRPKSSYRQVAGRRACALRGPQGGPHPFGQMQAETLLSAR